MNEAVNKAVAGTGPIGMVIEHPKIQRHLDQNIRNLAGKKVVIHLEETTPVFDETNTFLGVRVGVLPLELPNPHQQLTIMLHWIRTDDPLILKMRETLGRFTVAGSSVDKDKIKKALTMVMQNSG